MVLKVVVVKLCPVGFSKERPARTAVTLWDADRIASEVREVFGDSHKSPSENLANFRCESCPGEMSHAEEKVVGVSMESRRMSSSHVVAESGMKIGLVREGRTSVMWRHSWL